MARHPSHILELARRGAEHRYHELKAEIASLVKLFPHLPGHSGGPLSAPVETVKRASRRRRRRKMSEAARKAVSERMKKFWAARRKASAKA
jgi:FAD/FMN-containing dehydrogenase